MKPRRLVRRERCARGLEHLKHNFDANHAGESCTAVHKVANQFLV